ncbi:MAG: hypothetical protein ACYDB2_06540 [Acidimicrobiales bacterium]
MTTKIGPGRDPWGKGRPGATPGQLRRQVQENIRQLGLDHLDVVNVRVRNTGFISELLGAF